MKFGHRINQEPDDIQMAPLIDIVFLTLVFFMTTAVYTSLETEIDITLPTAESALQNERMRGEIYVNLMENGQIVVNNKVVELDELQDILDRVSKHFLGHSVIVRGDAKANLGRAIAILDCCKKADIQNVAFAAISPGNSNGS